MKRNFATMIALVFLAGCSVLTPRPQVIRRFSQYRVVEQPPANTPLVSLTTFSTPVPAVDPPRGLLNMAERGQAELVRALAAKTDGAPALARALALPFAPEQERPAMIDRSRVKRRVVFSIEKRSPGPADRINLVRVRVKLPQIGADAPTFVGWNRMESEYRTIDLGKLTSTQTRTMGGELGLSIPVLSAAPNVSASAEKSLEEEVTVQRRVPSLHGTLALREASLMEEGVSGVDLTGNVSADFEIVLPFRDGQAYSFTFTAKDGAPDCTQRPSLRSHVLRYPVHRDTLKAEVEMEYVVRQVGRGVRTEFEADDWVTFVNGTHPTRTFTLIPGEDLAVSVFTLRSAGNPLQVADALAGGPLPLQDLRLATYEDAFRVLSWLHRCEATIPGYPLSLNGTPLTSRSMGQLLIQNDPLGASATPPARPAPN